MAAIDRIFYEIAYRISRPRWDDGQIPPQLTQLISKADRGAKALDLGCGTGTHSIYLAKQGLTVTGIDASETAIRRAREKASQAGVRPELVIHDVTHLDFLHGPFQIALDVGCLHGLRPAEKQRYATELARLMPIGGTLLVWGMEPQSMGIGLTREMMEEVFEPAFKLDRVEDVQFHGRPSKWYWLARV